MARWPITGPSLAAAGLIFACGGSPPAPTRPAPPAPAPTASAPPPVPKDEPAESPAARAARIAAARRRQCERLAGAMQARGQDVLLNVHDAGSLIAIAGELDESADRVDRVDVDPLELAALAALQHRYLVTSRAMARALFATADASGFEQRKVPLAAFRELEPQLRGLMAELSDHCSGGRSTGSGAVPEPRPGSGE